MILRYESYELDNFIVFERVAFSAPFKPSVTYTDEACFVYSLSGEGVSYGGLATGAISEGEGILMKCGSFVNHWKRATRGDHCEILTIHVTPAIIGRVYENNVPAFLKSQGKRPDKVFVKVPSHRVVDEFIKGLTFYFDHPELITEALISLKVQELILLLYEINYEGIRAMLLSLFDPVDLNFKSVIETHLYRELDIIDYVALTNTSHSTFKRKFKQVFKDTPASYILSKRLEKASHLLKETDLRVTEICFACGYKDLSTFSRSFSKRYGVSPTHYRSSL